MTKNTKHIKMPKAIAEAWLKDLRANPKQGFKILANGVGGYCCLGRLQVVVSGDVERQGDGSSYGNPSLGWLGKNNIKFSDKDDMPYEVPYCTRMNTYFTKVNDNKVPFSTIADLLEEEIEYND